MGCDSQHDLSESEKRARADRDEARRRHARAKLMACLQMPEEDAEAVLEIYDALGSTALGGDRLAQARVIWKLNRRIDKLIDTLEERFKAVAWRADLASLGL
jgi:hypothetical protein